MRQKASLETDKPWGAHSIRISLANVVSSLEAFIKVNLMVSTDKVGRDEVGGVISYVLFDLSDTGKWMGSPQYILIEDTEIICQAKTERVFCSFSDKTNLVSTIDEVKRQVSGFQLQPWLLGDSLLRISSGEESVEGLQHRLELLFLSSLSSIFIGSVSMILVSSMDSLKTSEYSMASSSSSLSSLGSNSNLEASFLWLWVLLLHLCLFIFILRIGKISFIIRISADGVDEMWFYFIGIPLMAVFRVAGGKDGKFF